MLGRLSRRTPAACCQPLGFYLSAVSIESQCIKHNRDRGARHRETGHYPVEQDAKMRMQYPCGVKAWAQNGVGDGLA
jgi:hypothetical protein